MKIPSWQICIQQLHLSDGYVNLTVTSSCIYLKACLYTYTYLFLSDSYAYLRESLSDSSLYLTVMYIWWLFLLVWQIFLFDSNAQLTDMSIGEICLSDCYIYLQLVYKKPTSIKHKHLSDSNLYLSENKPTWQQCYVCLTVLSKSIQHYQGFSHNYFYLAVMTNWEIANITDSNIYASVMPIRQLGMCIW